MSSKIGLSRDLIVGVVRKLRVELPYELDPFVLKPTRRRAALGARRACWIGP